MKPVRIVIMAKAPQPGLCKTRLIPVLGAERAAILARRMLETTLTQATNAAIGAVELCASPAFEHRAWLGIQLPDGVQTAAQGEGDLGTRMARAVQRGLASGQSVLLIGTDCVEMDAALLCKAAVALDDHDAVMFEAADGGYALLGLRKYDPLVFSDMAWSTSTVAADTRHRFEQLGWSVQTGDILHDIDEPEDLVYLPPEWQ